MSLRWQMTTLPSEDAMAEKTKQQSKDPNSLSGNRVVNIPQLPGETDDTSIARGITRPEVGAATTSGYFNLLAKGADINALADELKRQSTLANDGDLTRAEAMLMSQAHSLDAMFNELARRAALNMGEYLTATETYMRMAMKAQSQCRATLQTLGELKAPRSIAFIRQANLANGPQQVNNGPVPVPRAETPNPTNELLEASHGERMDSRAASATGAIDSAMATVEPVDWTAKRAG
ncbi:hypothetical protein PWP93_04810 [Paraburkholderia sp. A1RI-2L]|uniref:hypothetical protein n=1 Tax=Paraburkholderia sp. A1RI-2L TaxID=3028367 RepID=UPI003B7858B6